MKEDEEGRRRERGRGCVFFFLNDTATTEIYTLYLHDALPISVYLSVNINRHISGFKLATSMHVQSILDTVKPRLFGPRLSGLFSLIPFLHEY